MRLYKILQKPIVTEKTANMQATKPRYGFIVSPDATKIDVKMAIKELYGVEVAQVNILNAREKFKNGRKVKKQLKRRNQRKAYVTLKNKDDTIDVTLVK